MPGFPGIGERSVCATYTMMKKSKKIALSVAILFILLLAVYLVFFRHREEGRFFRLKPGESPGVQDRFRVDERLSKVFFKSGKKETWLEGLPTVKGLPLYLEEEWSLSIKPQIWGDVGFYTYLHVDNRQRRQEIIFYLEIERGKQHLRVGQVNAGRKSFPFFKHLSLQKGDSLVMRLKGRGVVFLGQPILYRIKPVPQRRNIILIGVDTLRWDQIGARVEEKPLTPHIDRFLRECVHFKNTVAQSSWTIPSFISLFTGLYEFHHQVDINRPLAPGIKSLVEDFSKEFITFGLHAGMAMRERWGHGRGFDYYKKAPYSGLLFPRAALSLFKEAVSLLGRAEFPDFFFFLHTYQVHDPYTPPREFLEKLVTNPRYRRLDMINQGAPQKTFSPLPDELKQAYKELYQAEIHAFDAYFGEFLDKLKQMGLYDRAMIVLMSDHGEEFYDHGGWAHGHSLYQEQIRVPLMIKFPGGRFAGRQVEETAGVIDILPTILGYYRTGFKADKIDGIDLMPLLEAGSAGKVREYVLSSLAACRYVPDIPPKFAIFYGDYKLIYNYPFSAKNLDFFMSFGLPPAIPEIEIYHLKADGEEKRNIAPDRPDLVKKFIPFVIKIKEMVDASIRLSLQDKKGPDAEAKKMLESLGYL